MEADRDSVRQPLAHTIERRASGDERGSRQMRRDTCFHQVALLRPNGIDAPEFVPKRKLERPDSGCRGRVHCRQSRTLAGGLADRVRLPLRSNRRSERVSNRT